MKFLKLELLVSATAMITAGAAVYVTMTQTEVMRQEAEMERQHMRLSVMPSVWVGRSIERQDSDDIGTLSIELVNRGLGPASIETFTVTYDGQIVKSWPEWAELIAKDMYNAASSEGKMYRHSITTMPQKYILREGISLDLFAIKAPLPLVEKLNAALPLTKVTMCSCSLYKECWLTENLSVAPVPVNSCKINPEIQFQSGS